MSAHRPQITLNNGVTLPAIGLGVFQSPPAETVVAVETAIATGYRLIDTAASYLNERDVGEGIRNSGIDRAQLFVQTKMWISDYGYDTGLRAFDVSVRKLGLEYVDAYLLHQPMPNEWERTVAAYKAAERLLADGRVRAIGVCNFGAKHLDDLIARSDVIPAMNQVEVHPHFTQRALRDAHARLGIATQAWSPLGGVNVYMPKRPNAPESTKTLKNPLEDPVIVALAQKYAKTPAQIILHWHVEHGRSAIPKSVKPPRIAENFDVFDFALMADDVAAIDALDTGKRGGPDPDRIDTTAYTMTIPD
ncbi:MAG TPA: aldo/keto reductase [Gemmatimonadaceae bacterium]|nr:aldo/keto reductase [Gemmatimonadaceae bacterium]